MGACAEKPLPYDPSQDGALRRKGTCASGFRSAVAPCEPARREASKTASEGDRGALDSFTKVHPRKSRIYSDYSVDSDKVGEGTFGVVRKGRHKGTSMTRAIKTLSKKEMVNIKMFRQEVGIMRELDHPNIVKLFEVFEDSTSIYLVMQFCQGGELFDRIIEAGRFDEGQTATVVQQILRAVFYLHSNMIAHRDLKPENFLLTSATAPLEDNCLRLIDFGFACRCAPGKFMKTKAGTPFYMAPQVIAGRYDHLCDTWSCGAIMFTLLCGYPPIQGRTDRETLDKVRVGTFSFLDRDWRHVSEDAKDLITQLLKRSTKERFTAEQALNHTWVTNVAPRKRSLDEVEGYHHHLICERMRRFRNKNRLKRVALQIIAMQLDERALKALREMFTVLDANGDGTLTIEEMRQAVQRTGLEVPKDLDELIEAADMDCSGRIDYSEFLASMLEQRDYLVEGAVKSAFATFDAAGKGRIARQELAKILGVGMQSEAEVQELLREVDKDGDGMINFDDFLAMMQSTPVGDTEAPSFHATEDSVALALSSPGEVGAADD